MNVLNLFKGQSFTTRPPERQTLTVPLHTRVDKVESQPVLAKAAEQIATSGLVWAWVSDGTAKPKLCQWDSAQRVFLQGSLQDWQLFFGRHWVLKDTNNQEFAGPSPAVCDRLLQAVLTHPELPTATWALQLAKQKGAK